MRILFITIAEFNLRNFTIFDIKQYIHIIHSTRLFRIEYISLKVTKVVLVHQLILLSFPFDHEFPFSDRIWLFMSSSFPTQSTASIHIALSSFLLTIESMTSRNMNRDILLMPKTYFMTIFLLLLYRKVTDILSGRIL